MEKMRGWGFGWRGLEGGWVSEWKNRRGRAPKKVSWQLDDCCRGSVVQLRQLPCRSAAMLKYMYVSEIEIPNFYKIHAGR